MMHSPHVQIVAVIFCLLAVLLCKPVLAEYTYECYNETNNLLVNYPTLYYAQIQFYTDEREAAQAYYNTSCPFQASKTCTFDDAPFSTGYVKACIDAGGELYLFDFSFTCPLADGSGSTVISIINVAECHATICNLIALDFIDFITLPEAFANTSIIETDAYMNVLANNCSLVVSVATSNASNTVNTNDASNTSNASNTNNAGNTSNTSNTSTTNNSSNSSNASKSNNTGNAGGAGTTSDASHTTGYGTRATAAVMAICSGLLVYAML